MSAISLDLSSIRARGEAGYAAERAKNEPLGIAYFKASASALGMIVACASEAYTMTVALHAQFPAQSDGLDLGSEMLSLRVSILAGLTLSHAIMHDSPGQASHPVRRLLRKFRVIPIFAIMGGMAVFMFAATAQTTGGDDGQGGGIAGMALGVVCGALFSVSFLASNKLAGIFYPALRTVLTGRAQQAKVARIAAELKATDDCQAQIAALKREIASREAPGALHRTVAEEAASIVGRVAAEAHDRHASREALGDDIRPNDVVDLPDTPLPALDQHQRYLKGLDVKFFLNLLKNKEA